MPKCTVCGKDVVDIGPLDVPYHVECVMAAWDRALRTTGKQRAEPPTAKLVLLPLDRSSWHR